MNGLTNFFNFTPTELSSAVIVFNILFSFLLQLVIVWTYHKTHKGFSYSQSFIFTVVMIGVLATVVMMVVANNLIGAFGLLGAFSLIRFRTIVKETKDVGFVFFALAIGVAVGTNNYAIALIATTLLCLMIFGMFRYNIGAGSKIGYLLMFHAEPAFRLVSLDASFAEHLTSSELLHAKQHPHANTNEYAFAIRFRDEQRMEKFLDAIRGLSGVSRVELITGKHSIEY
ncbi:MAG: DUF4956 domain-containing protein [bacterium]|nr:DUF4956 domain-containing protein [bacterium]